MKENTREREKKIYVEMLGNFKIFCNNKEVLVDEGKVHKLWTFLGFLIYNHKRNLAPYELSELLCNDETKNDPSKIVKNLAYRLRCMIAESDMPDNNYISHSSGGYAWNSNIPISIDCEVFEESILRAKALSRKKELQKEEMLEVIELLKESVGLYKGKFIPNATYDQWAMAPTEYYHRLYKDAVQLIFVMLEKINELRRYTGFITLCERSIKIDSLDEDLYILYMKALIKIGRNKEAIKTYEIISERMYDALGIELSEEINLLYEQAMKLTGNKETNITKIKHTLQEDGNFENPYFCSIQVFKEIYRFTSRRIARTGEPAFFMLCTLNNCVEEVNKDGIIEATKALKKSIAASIRNGDVFARYSKSQFLIMLCGTTYENGIKVGKRIENKYKKYKISKIIKFDYQLNGLETKNI